MISKGIGILPGNHLSYIDHVVPLCQIMGVPLLVTEPCVQEWVERFYPPMQVILAEPEDFDLDPFLKDYDLFVYVDFFRRASGCFQFQEYLSRRRVRSVMSLHGNPDKYWDMYWLERLGDEDIVLAYGPQLMDLVQKKRIPKQPVVSGNYRLAFYEQHAPFFDSKLPFKKEKKTLLYAPTWVAPGRRVACSEYSTFFEVYKKVFDTLSAEYQLIVKLHPYMVKMMPDEVERVVHDYPHIHFLNDFPLIYPLLKQVDLYLGDYSSIGYDFLYYDRPLFFLETQMPTALQKCGCKLRLEDLPFVEDRQKNEARHELYHHVFGPCKPLDQLKRDIADACRSPAD